MLKACWHKGKEPGKNISDLNWETSPVSDIRKHMSAIADGKLIEWCKWDLAHTCSSCRQLFPVPGMRFTCATRLFPIEKNELWHHRCFKSFCCWNTVTKTRRVALFPGTVAGYKLALHSVESIPSFLSLDWFGVSLQQGFRCSWSNISAKSLDLGPSELL